MSERDFVIGIDAGGTKTLAVVLDEERVERGRGWGGPGNYHSAGEAGARRAVEDAVRGALTQAGIGLEQVRGACLAMGGMDVRADVAIAEGLAHAVMPNVPTLVCNDGVAALAAGAGKPEGIVIVAGTGSVIYGARADGVWARVGGWGNRLDDEGSAWWLATHSLRAIVRAEDGREGPTQLTGLYLSALGLHAPGDLLGWAYGPEWTKVKVAGLAPLTVEAGQAGDETATRIARDGASLLGAAALVVAKKLGLEEQATNVILAGGVLRSEWYEGLLREAVHRRLPRAEIRRLELDAAVGAAWLALERLNVQMAGISEKTGGVSG